MTITYPLSLPGTPKPRKVQITGSNMVAVTASPFTAAQTVQAHQGQIWRAAIVYPPMLRATAAAWQGFLLSLRGSYGTFLLGDPAATTPRGIATGTPLVNGAAQTGQVLNTKGWTPSQTGILLAGDYIQLGTGATARLHQVVVAANSDAGGLAALDIWPRLRESPADNAAIVTASPVGLFRLATNDIDWDTDEALFYGISFEAVEAI